MSTPPRTGRGLVHVSGNGVVVNFGTITGNVSTGRTVRLPPEAARSAADTPAEGLTNLPAPPEWFAGRSTELAALHQGLTVVPRTPDAVPAVVVHGLGGVGKSTLALRYAQVYEESYDLVWWIDAATPGAVEAALAEITVHLSPIWASVTEQNSRPAYAAWALAWLRQHDRWLLVYDNVEDPKAITPYLGSLRRGHHLVTSRLSGGWRGVRTRVPLGVLPREAAADLLLSHLPGLAPSTESRWEAVQLAEELGRLPLALDQAGAFISETVTDFATYRSRLALQLDVSAHSEGAERTVARTWRLTLAAIAERDPLAVELLYALAWLDPDGCPRSLLGRLAPDALAADRALGLLNAFSMITLTDREARVHRLVQSVLRDDTGALPDSRARALRARGKVEQLLVEVVCPDGAGSEPDAEQLVLLMPHIRALAVTGPPEGAGLEVTLLFGRAAIHLRLEGQTVHALPLHRAYSEGMDREFGTGSSDAIISRNALAGAYEAAGSPREAVRILEPLLEQSMRVLGPHDLTTLNVRGNLASAYHRLGSSTKAVTQYRRAVAASRTGLGERHPRTLSLLGGLASAHQAAGRHREAITIYEHLLSHEDALTGWEKDLSIPVRQGARLRGNLATAYGDTGRYEEAIALLRTALAETEEAFGSDHPDTLAQLGNLGHALEAAGRLSEARPIYVDVLERSEQVLGEQHPDTLNRRANLAYLYATNGDLARGLDLGRLVLAQRRQVLGEDHPDTLTSMSNLAGALQAAEEPDEAIRLFEETLALRQDILGARHADTLTSFNNLATCHLVAGHPDLAIALLETALATQQRRLGPENPATMITLSNLAAACREAGDPERAFELLTTVLYQRTRVLGEDHPDTLGTLANLARHYEATGELDRALPLYESAHARLVELVGSSHPTTVAVGEHLARAVRSKED
ncbi:tetratricopeptide repeat protein [Kitasatospora sp. NPDC093806]|uniref:tetratricopeptide repeat protein n=1 Tax=Kitasatospora sp. NPDC093806 TaxID=3155075 RepID=UPI0034404216